jgi:hypothetical protein
MSELVIPGKAGIQRFSNEKPLNLAENSFAAAF